MAIVFMGTPEFAVPSLQALHSRFGVALVVTTPDAPQGRGLRLLPSPVKRAAMELGIPVAQPERLRDEHFLEQIRQLRPEFIIVVAFRILPPELYTQAWRAAFCVHPSLLPKYRGAAPIHWTIIRGERWSGVTSFLLEQRVDTGAILLQRSIPVPEDATAGELHDLLMPLAAEVAVETVEGLRAGTLVPIPQDEHSASTAPKLRPEDCHLRWDRPAEEVRRWIHGLSPEPGAWVSIAGERFRFLRARAHPEQLLPPRSFRIQEGRFLIGCMPGCVEILELQRAGRRAMRVEEFLRGWRGPSSGTVE